MDELDRIRPFIPEDAETQLVFFVNGKKVTVPDPQPEWTLLWYLRNKLALTGTKYGCGEGGCGACTVMLSRYLPDEQRVKHYAVNACLTPICAVYGQAVTTVEGIGSVQDGLHPVQERIAKAHGSQCGFCTPGFVMSMYALLRNQNKLEYHDIEEALQGNLCRCTGYRPIIEGFKTFMEDWEVQYSGGSGQTCSLGEKCCRNQKDDIPTPLFDKTKFKPYDPSQEPIFPPELKLEYEKYNNRYLFFKGLNVTWVCPNNFTNLLDIKQAAPESKIVSGNTEVGVEMNIKRMVYKILIYINLPKLNMLKVNANSYFIGSTVSLTEVQVFLQGEAKNNPITSKFATAIVEMLHWFAGTQVRNVATIAGNIVTASPISDLNPILMACNAKLVVEGKGDGLQHISIAQNFFTSYRKTSLSQDHIVVGVEIPFSDKNTFFKAYKQSKRKDDDISIVTAAFMVKIDDEGFVSDANLCYGGMGPTTVRVCKASQALKGKYWDKNMLDSVFEELKNELDLDISVPGGMAEYRKSLCLSMFFKFYLWVQKERNEKVAELRDNAEKYNGQPKSSQYFDLKNDKRKPTDSVGLPVSHASALKHATGEALYCDDIPHVQGELYLSLVFSSKPHAKILSINATKALSLPGVVAFFSANDLDKACNKLGPIFKDEEIFSTNIVTSRACVLGAIVAKSEDIAKKSKYLVDVEYEDLTPVIVTIEEAIAHNSYFNGSPRRLVKGDVNKAFDEADHILEGRSRSSVQEHFYLETFGAFAARKEDELEVISSMQDPGGMARLTSEALGIPNNKIIAKTKRIGGGFGGKETRPAILILPVALAAYKLKKPIRAVFDRDEDMEVTGNRHSIMSNYKVAFNNDGKIVAAKFNLYSNAGNSMDISCSMNERLVTHVDNCYFIPNIEVNGYICKTNLPSNTALRGFGGPQAMFAAENMIRDVANALGKPYEEIVEINIYKEGQLTHFNQALSYCTIGRCWNECIDSCDYWKRKAEVEAYNRSNRWKKKGLALVPTKYGISFGTDLLMQAGALVIIYTDGSVLLSIGGIEMGQGLFTKMIQIASRVLEVSIEKIHLSEMSTDKVPNSSPTAASISSDLYGMAVVDACKTLITRLKPYKENDPDKKWEDWVISAYLDRVSLSATGFYAAPKIEYNAKTNNGDLFEYFTYGVACSEVMIDCLTGDHNVLRTDIVMDLGESLNPAIDIGQVEGAFMQGYGLFTIEELVFSPSGSLLSKGPGAYKIPAISDIPKEFNVSLLKGAPNPRAVYSSKAVGEPPLFLASSVFFAIKDAIRSARIDAGASGHFYMEAPATCERIRMACEDDITRQVIPTITRNGKSPWNVVV